MWNPVDVILLRSLVKMFALTVGLSIWHGGLRIRLLFFPAENSIILLTYRTVLIP